jgi:hypothetical protein
VSALTDVKECVSCFDQCCAWATVLTAFEFVFIHLLEKYLQLLVGDLIQQVFCELGSLACRTAPPVVL